MITNIPSNSTAFLRSHVATSKKIFDFLQNTAMALVIGTAVCWSTTAQSQMLAMTSESNAVASIFREGCRAANGAAPLRPVRLHALGEHRTAAASGMTRHATGVDMIKLILAIATAAACAGIVVLAPELGPKSAMASTQSSESGVVTQGFVVATEKRQSDGGCLQHWPYYEQSCLRDARLPNGERVVRVIAIDRTGKH